MTSPVAAHISNANYDTSGDGNDAGHVTEVLLFLFFFCFFSTFFFFNSFFLLFLNANCFFVKDANPINEDTTCHPNDVASAFQWVCFFLFYFKMLNKSHIISNCSY